MEYLTRPMETKEVTELGTFEGLASVYNNVDLGGDIIVPGAFKEFYYTKDRQIRILDSHNTRIPIGKGAITDTHVGLAIKGKLNLAIPQARVVHELMKDGITDGLSIGFDILDGGAKIREDSVREISGIKLWEISTTAFPMNQSATISAVKSMPQFTTIRECEQWVRDEFKLSHAQAKDFVVRFKKALVGVRDEPPRDEATEAGDVKEAVAFLQSISNPTNS